MDDLDQALADLKASPAYQLWLANNACLRVMRRVLVPFDLTHVQYVVLGWTRLLTRGGRQTTQAEVCRFADLDENMTSQVVRTLAQKDLLVREKHPCDGRAHLLRLTEKGDALASEAKAAVKPAVRTYFGVLEGDEVELASILSRLNEVRCCSHHHDDGCQPHRAHEAAEAKRSDD